MPTSTTSGGCRAYHSISLPTADPNLHPNSSKSLTKSSTCASPAPIAPQTDGLSERAAQTLKQYYCHDRQNRWRALAPASRIRLQHHNHCHTHKLSPYRNLYSFDPHTIHLDNDYELSSPVAEEWLDRMTTVAQSNPRYPQTNQPQTR